MTQAFCYCSTVQDALPLLCISLSQEKIAGQSATTSAYQKELSCGCSATCSGWCTPPRQPYFRPPNNSNQFRATMECHCCDAMYRAMGNRHFLYTGFIPEVARAGMDRIPSGDANPEVVLPSISELMARRAGERGDGNLWAKEIHYPHQDLFIPADFSSSSHIFTVWAIKSGTHLMAAEWGKGYQHRYKVVLLEHGVPVENTIPYDSEGEDPCPTVNAYLAPQGLIQDPPASWTDEATICSSYKPHSWEEFEASKAVFASCSTQVQQYLLTQCWR